GKFTFIFFIFTKFVGIKIHHEMPEFNSAVKKKIEREFYLISYSCKNIFLPEIGIQIFLTRVRHCNHSKLKLAEIKRSFKYKFITALILPEIACIIFIEWC